MGETAQDRRHGARPGERPLGLRLVVAAGVSALVAVQASEVAMAKTLGPSWSEKDVAAGRKMADAAKALAEGVTGTTPFDSGQMSETLARYQDMLMAYPNVVAVSDGVCVQDDAEKPKACINVYVDRKLAPEQLDEDARLPAELDGVPVQVIEAGEIGTLPMK
jgi:hypothetical protein